MLKRVFVIVILFKIISFSQFNPAPQFIYPDINNDTINLLNDYKEKIVVLSFLRTYNLYSRLQINDFIEWKEASGRDIEFFIIFNEISQLIQSWKDTLFPDIDTNFKFFAENKYLRTQIKVLPYLVFYYDSLFLLTYDGYCTKITFDSLFYICDSIINNGTLKKNINDSLNDLVFYPNPVNDKLFFSSKMNSDLFSFKCYDVNGRLVNISYNGSFFDFSSISTGIYFIILNYRNYHKAFKIVHIK